MDLPEVAWLGLHEGEKAFCSEGSLELSQGRIGCRPATLCRARTRWDGKSCSKPLPCPVGSYREEALCKPFVTHTAVDLSLWADKVLKPELCALLAVNLTAETFHVVVDAPGNALAELSLAVESASSTPNFPAIRHAAEAHAEALRSIHGDTTTSHLELRVVCAALTFPPPKIQPAETDAGAKP